MSKANGYPVIKSGMHSLVSWRVSGVGQADALLVSVIMPVLNEADTLGNSVASLQSVLDASAWCGHYEIIVADNGSTDGSASIAKALGVRVITVPTMGYGSACWHACQQAQGGILLFFDGDGSPHPADCIALIQQIHSGAGLAIGVRQCPEPNSMSRAQTFGNALACFLMRVLWRIPASDIGPLRAITRTVFDQIELRDRGFGWTVEMQISAATAGFPIVEIPVRWRARAAGVSKIGGTWLGVMRAGWGILGKIAVVRLRDSFRDKQPIRYHCVDHCDAFTDLTFSETTHSPRKPL
ncbi:glycosyltransferase family 2 protein [Halioxenophilus aromaticivorans]|uniref:Glycosyltransferase 2-like domain-containing protein n=1 Tax=Halioxenophilus aromaticivorans TaxID=1306992 RepID=A0AAV3U999_9ALTE